MKILGMAVNVPQYLYEPHPCSSINISSLRVPQFIVVLSEFSIKFRKYTFPGFPEA